ncbi:2-oxo acid dehydrogenase subunit E2 [bacterium]|nr:MAG: 2-oxo acid dehydrogenase subunit E2 [bacterium]
MAEVYEMPELAESVVEGEVLRWIKKEGERVERDEPFVEIMTEKVTVEVPAPHAGTLIRTLAKEGQVLPVGAPLAVFGEPGENADAALAAFKPAHGGNATPAATAAPAPAPAPVPTGASVAPPPVQAVAVPPNVPATLPADGAVAPQPVHREGRALAAPAVRLYARQKGVDLAFVEGSGPAGRIRRADIDRFLSGRASAPAPAAAQAAPTPAAAATIWRGPNDRVEPLKGLRRIIAQRMPQSKHVSAHTLNVDEADLTALVELRKRFKPIAEAQGVKLTYLAFIAKATVAALKLHPFVNASLDEAAHEIVVRGDYNIGVAVDTEQGLMVPVVHGAERRSVLAIASEIARLAEAARAGKLTPADMEHGTFTISNSGSIGGLFTAPVINQPEVAILGVHPIKARAVVRDGAVVAREMMYLSLSYDHRLVDGALAVRFLSDLIRLLENPEMLLIEG